MIDVAAEIEEEVQRWDTDTSDNAAWNARGLVDRLSKDGHGEAAVSFGERALEQWPESEAVRSAVAWAYYRRDIASADSENLSRAEREQAKGALERIRLLTSSDPYGKYSAAPRAALKVARLARDDWPLAALEILDSLDPARLDDSAKGAYPSDVARWHLAMTRLLEKLERWDDLLHRCDEALASTGLREEDRRWIRRRRAIALGHLGRPDEAATVLRDLLPELSEWWFEAELAQAFCAAGERRAAVGAAQRALDKPGELASKWRTIMLLAELLSHDGDGDLALKHIQLARALRTEQGWPPDRDLESLAARSGISGEPVKPDLGKLQRGWRAAPDPSRHSGVVKTLLPGEHSGFITIDGEDTDVYFAMPRNSTNAAPQPGTSVMFRLVDSFDKKKNQPSQRAVEVRSADQST